MKQISEYDLNEILKGNSLLTTIDKSEFASLVKGIQGADIEKSVGEEQLDLKSFVKNTQVYDVMKAPGVDSLDKSIIHEETIVIEKELLEKAQRVYANTYKNRKLGRVGQPIQGGRGAEVYANTYKNRKLGRVGKPVGEHKEGPGKSERKPAETQKKSERKPAETQKGSSSSVKNESKEEIQEIIEEVNSRVKSETKNLNNSKTRAEKDLKWSMENIDDPFEFPLRVIRSRNDIIMSEEGVKSYASVQADMKRVFEGDGSVEEKRATAETVLNDSEKLIKKRLKLLNPMATNFSRELIREKANLKAIKEMRDALKATKKQTQKEEPEKREPEKKETTSGLTFDEAASKLEKEGLPVTLLQIEGSDRLTVIIGRDAPDSLVLKAFKLLGPDINVVGDTNLPGRKRHISGGARDY